MIGKLLGGLVILMLTIIPAFYQGRYLNRWGTPAEMGDVVAQMHQLPAFIGDFKHVGDGEALGEHAYSFLGLSGDVSRHYVNVKTGEKAMLLLLVGKPGPLVRHPPNVCYESLGMTQVGSVESINGLGSNEANQFKLIHYKQPGLDNSQFVVAYSHCFDSLWSAPDMPRLEFGGYPYLYKAQVLIPAASSSAEQKVTLTDFLNGFIDSFETYESTRP